MRSVFKKMFKTKSVSKMMQKNKASLLATSIKGTTNV